MGEQRKQLIRKLVWGLTGLIWTFLVVFAVVIGPSWLAQDPHHRLTADQELKAKNDVRTTLVQALGGAALAIGTMVTYRTFRHNREEQDRTYRLSQSRQATETYAKAVEQLGHDEAPVRLGAMYSLERLAQENLDLRQTVVNVLCAYLRMPYVLPGSKIPAKTNLSPAYELQVRQTAQRLLADHLRPPGQLHGDAQLLTPALDQPFWPGISLDLTGATLVDFTLEDVLVDWATFAGATFTGDTQFNEATFTGGARFERANFAGDAAFNGATFGDNAASFSGATFAGLAGFIEAAFTGNAFFDEATFTGDAAWFGSAAFAGDAAFHRASFGGDAEFEGVTFAGDAAFDGVTFAGDAQFKEATFTGDAQFEAARLMDLAAAVGVWPEGWTVRRDPENPNQGTLVRTGSDQRL